MLHYLLICLLMLCLYGCASLTYVEPTSGDRARVRFVTDTSFPIILRVYDRPDCSGNEYEWMRLRNGYVVNSSPKRLGMPLWNYHENAAKEVYVAVGKPLTGIFFGYEQLSALGVKHFYECGVYFNVEFQNYKDYEVSFEWKRTECFVTVSEIQAQPSGTYSFLTVAKFDSKVTSANRSCLKLFKRLRLD